MKLYDLAQNYLNLIDLMENPEVPEEMLKQSLAAINEDIEVKAENLCKVMRSIDVDINGLKEEEKRLSERRKALENKNEQLKRYLESTMLALNTKKIKGKVFTVSIQKNPSSVDITAEKDIPKEYLIPQPSTINRKAILEVLKSGGEVPGATIKQTEGLRIR